MIKIEKNREHEREEKSVEIEEKILNIFCSFMYSQKVWKLNPSDRKITLTKLLIKQTKITNKGD